MERKSDVGIHQPSSSDYSMVNESSFMNEQHSVSRFFCEDEVVGPIGYPKSVSPDKLNVPPSRLKDYPAVNESHEWPKSGKLSKLNNESSLMSRNSNWEAMELIRNTESSISEEFKGKEQSVVQICTERNRWNEVLNQIAPESTIKGSTTLSALYKICSVLFKLHHKTELLVKEQQEIQTEETLKLRKKIKELDAIIRAFEGKEKRDAELKAIQDAKIKAEIEELFGPDEGDFDQKKAQMNLENYKESGITDCLSDLLQRFSKEIEIPKEGYLNFHSLSPEDIYSSLQSKLVNITQSTVARVTKSLIKKPELEEKSTGTEDKLIDKYKYDELQAKYDKFEIQCLLAIKQKDRAIEELKEARVGLDKVTFEKKTLGDNIESLKQEIIIIKELKHQAETKLEEATTKYEISTKMNLSLEKQLTDLNIQLLIQTENMSQLKIDLQHAIESKPEPLQIEEKIESTEVPANLTVNESSIVEYSEYSDSDISNPNSRQASPKAAQGQTAERPSKTAASNARQSASTITTYQDSNPRIHKPDYLSPSHSKETIIPTRSHRSQHKNQIIDSRSSQEIQHPKEGHASSISNTSEALSNKNTSQNRQADTLSQNKPDSSPLSSFLPSNISPDTESLTRDPSYRDEKHSRNSVITRNPEFFELRDSVELSSISRISYMGQASQADIESYTPLEDMQHHLNLHLPLNETILSRFNSPKNSSISPQKPVVSIKYSADNPQKPSLSSDFSQPTESPINHSRKSNTQTLKSSGQNIKKFTQKELESNPVTKTLLKSSYIDRGIDLSYDLIWQQVNENSKGVQYSQDFPEFNSVDNGDSKKEYLFSFNPNNVFGLKGDVYYQGFQKVFQAMPSVSDNTSKHLYKRIQDIAKYNV